MLKRAVKLKTVLPALLAFAVAAAVASAASNHGSSSEGPRSLDARGGAHYAGRAQHHVSAALIHAVALFHTKARGELHRGHALIARSAPAVTEPPSVQQLLQAMQTAGDPSNTANLLVSGATTVVNASPSSPVWAIPGRAGACVVAAALPRTTTIGQIPADGYRAAEGGCDPTAVIASQGLLDVAREPDGTHLVYGLVPNGNNSVTVTEPSGATIALPVTDNAVSGVVPVFPSELTLSGINGSTITLHP